MAIRFQNLTGRLRSGIGWVSVAWLALAWGGRPTAAPPTPPAPAPARANATVRLGVDGLQCEGCARGLASELRRLPGVVSADVNVTNGIAVVRCDTNRVSRAALNRAIEDAGFKPRAAAKREATK